MNKVTLACCLMCIVLECYSKFDDQPETEVPSFPPLDDTVSVDNAGEAFTYLFSFALLPWLIDVHELCLNH